LLLSLAELVLGLALLLLRQVLWLRLGPPEQQEQQVLWL
jgi:hypothetical protein